MLKTNIASKKQMFFTMDYTHNFRILSKKYVFIFHHHQVPWHNKLFLARHHLRAGNR